MAAHHCGGALTAGMSHFLQGMAESVEASSTEKENEHEMDTGQSGQH